MTPVCGVRGIMATTIHEAMLVTGTSGSVDTELSSTSITRESDA